VPKKPESNLPKGRILHHRIERIYQEINWKKKKENQGNCHPGQRPISEQTDTVKKIFRHQKKRDARLKKERKEWRSYSYLGSQVKTYHGIFFGGGAVRLVGVAGLGETEKTTV